MRQLQFSECNGSKSKIPTPTNYKIVHIEWNKNPRFLMKGLKRQAVYRSDTANARLEEEINRDQQIDFKAMEQGEHQREVNLSEFKAQKVDSITI